MIKPSIYGFELGVGETKRWNYLGREGRCSGERVRNGQRLGGGVGEECAGEGRASSRANDSHREVRGELSIPL